MNFILIYFRRLNYLEIEKETRKSTHLQLSNILLSSNNVSSCTKGIGNKNQKKWIKYRCSKRCNTHKIRCSTFIEMNNDPNTMRIRVLRIFITLITIKVLLSLHEMKASFMVPIIRRMCVRLNIELHLICRPKLYLSISFFRFL